MYNTVYNYCVYTKDDKVKNIINYYSIVRYYKTTVLTTCDVINRCVIPLHEQKIFLLNVLKHQLWSRIILIELLKFQ